MKFLITPLLWIAASIVLVTICGFWLRSILVPRCRHREEDYGRPVTMIERASGKVRTKRVCTKCGDERCYDPKTFHFLSQGELKALVAQEGQESETDAPSVAANSPPLV